MLFATRDYADRCSNCRHYHEQNNAVGDCRAFHKDVLWESVHPCSFYVRRRGG